MVVKCPLEQMKIDAYREARIFQYFMFDGGWPTRGMRMWYMATVGFGLTASREAMGSEWISRLERKYP